MYIDKTMETYSNYYKKQKQEKEQYQYYIDDKLFCDWIDNVEKIVFKKIHIRLLDLDDEDYMACFERGITSSEMSHIVLENYNKYIQFIFG